MKFIATTSDKMSGIPLLSGQLIFSRDDRVIYLDSDQRTAFTTFIIIDTEAERKNLVSPISAFYFVEETAILWRYDKKWKALNEPPKERLIFADAEGKPETGEENILYVEGKKLYRWDGEKYIVIGVQEWEPIVVYAN